MKIATVIAGQSPPSQSYNQRSEGLPFLQGNADFSYRSPVPRVWCNSSHKTSRKGDTLFSVRAPVGEMNRSDRNYAIGRGLAAIRAKGCDADFLYHALQRWRLSLQLAGQGTTFEAITARHFADLFVALPTRKSEQAAIARILDAVDTVLERTREAIGRARRFHHSLLHELLKNGISPKGSGKGRYPEGWRLVTVDEVATVGSGVTLGKDVSGRKTVDLPYLRVANVQDGRIDLSTVKTVGVPVEEVHKFRLEAGDVLMTEGGDIDKLGRGTIWEGQIPDCLHQNHIFRIRANRDLLEPAFYAMVVESDIAKRYFSRVAKRTTNLASTNKTQVRTFRFPLPPTTQEQRQIADVVALSKSLYLALSRKEAVLYKLKSSLMQDLLTGKVRVGDIEVPAL